MLVKSFTSLYNFVQGLQSETTRYFGEGSILQQMDHYYTPPHLYPLRALYIYKYENKSVLYFGVIILS